MEGDDQNKSSGTAVPEKERGASISDLAPLYDVFGQTLGVLNHQVITDQRRELEELKQLKHELKKMKITGPGGSPVYAYGLVDEHGYPHAVPSTETVEFWYVRMCCFPIKSVPISVLRDLEVWLGGINLAGIDEECVFDFANNAGSVEFQCPMDLWFDVCGGNGSLPLSVNIEDENVNDDFLEQFDGETITFGEVAVDLAYIRRFLLEVCKADEIDTRLAKQHYKLYGIAEEAVADVFTPVPSGGYHPRQYRNVSEATMAEFGRRLFLVRDGLKLLGRARNLKVLKSAAVMLARLAGETTSKDIFIDRAKHEVIKKIEAEEKKKARPRPRNVASRRKRPKRRQA